MREKFLSVLLTSAVIAANAAFASDVFVIDAKGMNLTPGQKLDGETPLILGVGQRVTLVTGDGRTIKLKGPSDTAPAPKNSGAGGDVMNSLKGLLKAREADTSSAGIIRKGGVVVMLPAPWLIDVEDSGERCLIEGERAVLWRSSMPTAAGNLEISPVDHSWAANAPWPADKDKMSLPATLRLNDGQAYSVKLDNASANLTIHVIPKIVQSPAAIAAWMIEVGCEMQAEALIGPEH